MGLPDPQVVDWQSVQRNFEAIGRLNFEGAGSPQGVVAAPVGATYRNLEGGAGTTLWVKESSPTPTTGWVSK